MQRQSLETVVLKSKLIDMGAPETVLGLAMDPPLKSDIHNAILQLKELGGLLNTVNGEFVLNDGDMTFIGKVMAHLPVDIRVSRLIVLGHTFSVVDEAVIIGAALSVQGVFSEHYNREMTTYATKLAWANGTGSDLIALLTAYKVYQERVRQNQREFDHRWAERCGIQLRMMHEVVELVQEINHRLAYFNIQPIPAPYAGVMNEYERCIILKVVFAGAFYPNFAVYGENDADSEKETFRITNGRNPCNTVILQGLPSKHIGQLYRKSIKEIFWNFLERSTKIDVSFDNSEKVYVTFTPSRSDIDSQLGAYLTEYQDNHDVSGNVLVEVYKAVKYGQLNRGLKLNVLNPGKAQDYALDHGVAERTSGEFQWKKQEKMNRDYVVYPRKNYIDGKLTHFVHLHKFFILPREEAQDEDRIRTLLNSSANLESVRKEQLKVGMMVAAQRQFGNNLYFCRARVIDNDFSQPQKVEVFFIDFGNTANLSMACIRLIRQGLHANDCLVEQLPPRAIECRLACIAPTAISAIRGRWTEETIRRFTNKIPVNSKVRADVYAFVDGIAYVTLNHGYHSLQLDGLWLQLEKVVRRTRGEYSPLGSEVISGLSDVIFDHDRRMACELLKHPYILDDVQIDAIVKPQEAEVNAPPENICDKQLSLKGPTSPLTANLFSLTKSASMKNCRIERNSVNSVLLDNNYQDYHQKMLVATHIKKSGNGDLLLYQTTVMPNIPGLMALLSLIFCPTAEFCRDSDNSRFISVLTGLGSKPGTKIPMFEEHDMQIPLDIKLDHDDIECINQLRYSMSSLLLLRNGQDVPELENHARYKLQQKIRDLTLKKFPPKPFVWNQCDVKPTELLQISDLHNGASIFPFLTSLKLDPMATEEQTERLNKSCKELYEIISINRIQKDGVKCLLCDAYLNGVIQVRLHVFTKLHQDREAEIGFIKQKY
uniref:Uncharacterized protein n=1 Tax=Phlebotomus papatasi TaxID=29031 RepID=A0A1B0DNM6_PHLPP